MKETEYSRLILTPVISILEDGLSASIVVEDKIEFYPLSEYFFQTVFLKMTGFMEQKCKCITWDIATIDLSFRRKFLEDKARDGFSTFESKNFLYMALLQELKRMKISFPLTDEWKRKNIEELNKKFKNFYEKSDFIYLNEKIFNDSEKLRKCISIKNLGTTNAFFADSKIYDLMIDYRNKCAHNVHSYMKYLPTISMLQDPMYKYVNFFFFFYLIAITDDMFIKLYESVFNNILSL